MINNQRHMFQTVKILCVSPNVILLFNIPLNKFIFIVFNILNTDAVYMSTDQSITFLQSFRVCFLVGFTLYLYDFSKLK